MYLDPEDVSVVPTVTSYPKYPQDIRVPIVLLWALMLITY